MRKTVRIALAALCIAQLTACVSMDRPGGPVRFCAHAKGGATKTAYSGFSNGQAVIAWSAGDAIRIYSPATNPAAITSAHLVSAYYYYDYSVTEITTENQVSSAQLTQVGNGLQWADGNESAHFYAVYPSTQGVDIQEGVIRATVTLPASQDGSDTISDLPLVARQDAAHGADVDLTFHSAFSTFQFTIKSAAGNGSLTLNSFTLSTGMAEDYVAGTGYYAIGSGTLTYGSSKSKSVTVTFDPQPVITDAQSATFTLFTLPISLTDMSISVNYTKEGSTVTKHLRLDKNGTPLTFAPGDFIRIYGLAVPEQGIRFFLSDNSVDPLGEANHVIDY